MRHRTALARTTATTAIVLLGVCTPAFAATATSVTKKDPRGDAITATGEVGSPKLDIHKITGAKAGSNLRLTMSVRQLPGDIAAADPAGNHLVIGVGWGQAGGGFEPTPNGKVRDAGGGDVCKGSTTSYDTDTDTVTMVLPLKCAGGPSAH